MSDFNQALAHILKWEGGYVNDATDRGGETNFGISASTLSRYNTQTGNNWSARDLTPTKAGMIYKRFYWDANRLGDINHQGAATASLDTVVHHGYGPKLIQQAVNDINSKKIAVDGQIGPASIKAINSVPGASFVASLAKRRKDYMEKVITGTPGYEKYRQGFANRLTDMLSLGGQVGGSLLGLAIVAGVIYFATKR